MLKTYYTIEKSIQIEKPTHDVFQALTDLNVWNQWSPWLCLEPEAKTVVNNSPHQIGHSQTWDGDRIGSGEMIITEMTANQKVVLDLIFKKPWKNQSQAIFTLKQITETQTQLSWTMTNSLPFFMFFLKNMIKGFISHDFHRGLLRLKDLLEKGTILSEIKYEGEKQMNGFHFYGVKKTCDISNIGPTTGEAFHHLIDLLQKGQIQTPDLALCFTHDFDTINNQCTLTSAFGYKNSIPTIEGLVNGHIPNHKAITAIHKGSYHQLGNPWSFIMNMQRFLKLKVNKKIDPYEIYINTPDQIPEKDLLTQVVLPIK